MENQPSTPYALVKVDGKEVHTQIGVSDERFQELGKMVTAVVTRKDITDTVDLLLEVSKIPQTIAENTIVYLHVGKYLRDVQLRYDNALKNALRESREDFGFRGRGRDPLEELLGIRGYKRRHLSDLSEELEGLLRGFKRSGANVSVHTIDLNDLLSGRFGQREKHPYQDVMDSMGAESLALNVSIDLEGVVEVEGDDPELVAAIKEVLEKKVAAKKASGAQANAQA